MAFLSINCPTCASQLRLPVELEGKKVKCPSCKNVFTATSGGEPSSGVQAEVPRRAPPPAELDETPSRPRRDDRDDDDDAPAPRSARRSRDDDDDEPRRRGRSRDDDDEDDDDRPASRRRSRDDDDDDDDDDRGRSRHADDDEDDPEEKRRRKKKRKRKEAAAEAAAAVFGPAISLMIVAALHLVGTTVRLVADIYAWIHLSSLPQPPGGASYFAGVGIGAVLGCVVLYIVGTIVMVGAFKLKGLTSYGTAMTASIVALLPCFSCCLGIPFGIWALVVLNKPEVKSAFRG